METINETNNLNNINNNSGINNSNVENEVMAKLMEGFVKWELPKYSELNTIFKTIDKIKQEKAVNDSFIPEETPAGKFIVLDDENDNNKLCLVWRDKEGNFHKSNIDESKLNSYYNVFFVKKTNNELQQDGMVILDNYDTYKNSVQIAFSKNDEQLSILNKVIVDEETGYKLPLNLTGQIVPLDKLNIILDEVNLNSQLEYMKQQKEKLEQQLTDINENKQIILDEFMKVYTTKKINEDIDQKTVDIFKKLHEDATEYRKMLENFEKDYNLMLESLAKTTELRKRNIKISALANITRSTTETLLSPHSDPMYACNSLLRLFVSYGMSLVEIRKTMSEANKNFEIEKERINAGYQRKIEEITDRATTAFAPNENRWDVNQHGNKLNDNVTPSSLSKLVEKLKGKKENDDNESLHNKNTSKYYDFNQSDSAINPNSAIDPNSDKYDMYVTPPTKTYIANPNISDTQPDTTNISGLPTPGNLMDKKNEIDMNFKDFKKGLSYKK